MSETVHLHEITNDNPLELEASQIITNDVNSTVLETPGYQALISPPDFGDVPYSFAPNRFYERYLKMHKVLVGKSGAEQLEEIHFNLADQTRPRYLSVAGWAAVEAALAQPDDSTKHRLALVESGLSCWQRAIAYQQQLNDSDVPYLREYDLPHRTALDIAVLPILKDMVFGKVKRVTSDQTFRDCLNIAQDNAVRLNLMKAEGNIEGLACHIGLGYECNALLAFNRKRSPTWFAIPSMVRADTGYHHRKQTHDLLVVHQKWGEIVDLTPIEVKSTASARDRERYEALLVRGTLHLSIPGWYKPEQILQLITDSEEGTISQTGERVVEDITDNLIGMVRGYYAGDRLGKISTRGTVTSFRDDSMVEARRMGVGIAA